MSGTRGLLLLAAIVASGCAAPSPPASQPVAPHDPFTAGLKPYVPATRPADPVTDEFPTRPRDAQPFVPLRYSVQLWEILMPPGVVAADDAFWKRVDEPATTERERLQQNGVRVGELPLADLEYFKKLVADRGGKTTTYNGLVGKQVEIPVHDSVKEQTLFYLDRDGSLAGRSWSDCDNLWYFSFETTPRRPDRVRLAFTPCVRSRAKRLIYATLPGRADRELQEVVEESQYDATIGADLALDRLLIIAPSAEARMDATIGGAFLTESTPSQRQERLILVIPRAFQPAGGKNGE